MPSLNRQLRSHNQTPEQNCRPASPLDAWRQFERGAHARPCASGGSRSALCWAEHCTPHANVEII